MRRKQIISPDGFREMQRSLVDLFYLIKLNRIGKNYSMEELSFLIGKNKKYMIKREKSLRPDLLLTKELCLIADVFDMQAPSLFMNSRGDYETVIMRASIVKKNGNIIHTIEKKVDGGRIELLCQLYEYGKVSGTARKREEKELAALIMVVGEVVNGSFFDKEVRSPFEIFLHCKRLMKRDIRPCLLEKALDLYSMDREGPQLQKCKGENGFGYKKIVTGLENNEEQVNK